MRMPIQIIKIKAKISLHNKNSQKVKIIQINNLKIMVKLHS